MDEEKEKSEQTDESSIDTDKNSSSTDNSKIKLPEDFQIKSYELIDMCDTEEKCQYVRNCLYEKEDKIRREKRNKESKNEKGKEKPNAVVHFTDSDSPSMY